MRPTLYPSSPLMFIQQDSSSPKWFSLLEMIVVLIIIGVIIIASRRLFEMPSQYLMDGERCMTSVDGQVKQFFYHAVSGKSLSISGALVMVDNYTIIFKPSTSEIILGYLSGSLVNTYDRISLTGSTTRTIGWCMSDIHHVSLSWWSLWSGIRIDLRKNLRNDGDSWPMTICAIDSNDNCINGANYTTGMISYVVCKEWWNNTCTTTRTLLYEFFDTRTQNIKTKKCLWLPLETECHKRSTDEF